MFKWIIGVIFVIALTACGGGGGSSSGGGTIKTPLYSVDCNTGVTCPNADDTSVFNGQSLNSVDCTWYCSNYKGQTAVYVSLTFQSWRGGCWAFDREFISSGICGFSAAETKKRAAKIKQ